MRPAICNYSGSKKTDQGELSRELTVLKYKYKQSNHQVSYYQIVRHLNFFSTRNGSKLYEERPDLRRVSTRFS